MKKFEIFNLKFENMFILILKIINYKLKIIQIGGLK